MSSATVTSDGLVWLEKDKDARLNYEFKLDNLMSPADALSSVAWSVTPSGALTVDTVSFEGRQIVAVLAGGAVSTWYALKFRWTTQAGLSDEVVLRVFVKEDEENLPQLGSALFPNRFSATASLRRDRLLLAASGVLPAVEISDDYLWEKLRSAEAEIGRRLRVPLVPTKFFPADPSEVEVAALAGQPWEVDPGYDYEPDFFYGEGWGHMQLRHKPVVSVQSVRIRFPGIAPGANTFEIPASWLRVDRKYGTLQFVPTAGSQTGSIPLNAFMLQALSLGRGIPFAVEISYTAGLANVARDFPDLLDVIKKRAVLGIVKDQFLPQSGSISADGLSQSISADMDKYEDVIDTILFGSKGNGGLSAAIHGVRLAVM